MHTTSLIAEGGTKPASALLEQPEFIYGTIGLAGALLAGAVVIYFVDRWRKRAALAEKAEAGEELTSFRAMYERGEITEAEYARLRQKVAGRVKPAAPADAEMAAAAIDPTAPAPPAPPRPAVTGPLPDDYFDDPPPPPPAGGSPPPA